MINVVCGIRSTGRICTDLAEALEAQGHEVKIAYGREEVPEKFHKYAVRIGNDMDVKLHGIRARLFDESGFGSKRATEAFIEWVKQYDPDVIHLHNVHGYYIHIGVLFEYLKTCGKRIIWTLHDCWAFTGHSAYCDAVQCTKWENGCYSCPQIHEYPKALIDHSKKNWKVKKKLFTGIPNMVLITPSHWLAGLVKKSFLKEYPVEVIHNGIDTAQFHPLENDFRNVYGLEGKFVLLGVASTWNNLKGYEDYFKLAEMLDDRFRIVMVGVTAEQKKTFPENMIGILKTNSLKELAYIYSSADVFLNFTYCDNYPTVNMESISCGTPVITYDTGGSPESIRESNGAVIQQGDLEQAKAWIERFCREGRRTVPEKEYEKENEIMTYSSKYAGGGTGRLRENGDWKERK